MERPDANHDAPLGSRLEALRVALDELRQGSPEAESSVRRIARSLLATGERAEAARLAESAGRVVASEPGTLEARAGELLTVVERIAAREGEDRDVTILVVEDEGTFALMVEEFLSAPGRTVVVAETGARAREVLENRPVDLVLLDLFLPDQDGREVLMGLRGRPSTAHVPVIVLSGSSGRVARSECFALGADEFLEKPPDPAVLMAAVARQLERFPRDPADPFADPLTGLLNRQGLEEAWKRSREGGGRVPICVVLVGVDLPVRSKVGGGDDPVDRALGVVGRTIGSASAVDETWGRWAGDKFVGLLPESPRTERIRELVERIEDGLPPTQGKPASSRGPAAWAGMAQARETERLVDTLVRANGRLRAARRSGDERVVGEPPEARDRALSVLLVEDDEVFSSLVKHRLEKEDLRVRHFEDGSEAFRAASEELADIVILDVKVPGMDGFELLGRLRSMPGYAHVPVMMLTSMNREADIVRGFDMGADDYMLKPFSPVELVARVRRLVHR